MMSAAGPSLPSSTLLPPKPFLQKMMSSRSKKDEKTIVFTALREMRDTNIDRYNSYVDELLAQIDSVATNRFCSTRLPFPLPSFRTKLGSLNRIMLAILSNEELNDAVRRRRALLIALAQLRDESGVRSLEAEALQRSRRCDMKEMLARTPENLETPKYTVLANYKFWEVRRYEQFTVCSSTMSGDASSPQATKTGGAFNALAGYIFGRNEQSQKMAMTTPVLMSGGKMSFVLPSTYWNSLEGAPTPVSGSMIKLEQSALSNDCAVIFFGGYCSDQEQLKYRKELLLEIERSGKWRVVESASPYTLQFNDPFTPPWKRRNEIAISVTAV